MINTRRNRNPLFWLSLVLLAIVFIGPVVLMILTSFKTRVESQSVPPKILPQEWTIRAYDVLIAPDSATPVLRWFLNSMVSATLHALLVVLVCSMAGYALARLRFPGRGVLFGLIVSTLFVPGFIFLMPNFEMMSMLTWLDSYLALIVPGAAGAFGVFFMRQFFLALPLELEEQARVDGAGPWRIFFSIILPNAKAAMTTLLVISFLANWNDFVWPLYVMFSSDMLTLPIGLSRLQGAYTIDYPVIMAGATVAAVPVLLLYVFVQRYVIDGVAASGLK
ncbi:carbohydrate ABC transporter permease [Tessaracoccus caeni]|uniref:carbohydrate ABC transporter permease n=1 Tax=Tessaracoccus caeni TaxID=3031239 RepID=UPI0023DCD6EE|nr:carbohydrate ABC transporter permease [Tessaracoccus caeni]MDF1487648.1 carbohydrate ABC transporter permease [Tessaracoccus caeni]